MSNIVVAIVYLPTEFLIIWKSTNQKQLGSKVGHMTMLNSHYYQLFLKKSSLVSFKCSYKQANSKSQQNGLMAHPCIYSICNTTGCPTVSVLTWTANIFAMSHCMRESFQPHIQWCLSIFLRYDMPIFVTYFTSSGSEQFLARGSHQASKPLAVQIVHL